eukprot:scaffold190_cov171-Amphora_coffeaeformis.AAC.1
MPTFNSFRFFAQRHVPKFVYGLAAGNALCMKSVQHTTVRLDYWEHDEKDFDVYIKNPTADDLPILLKKFDEEGLEVWPWIWTHPNSNGPHFVFIGLNEFYVDEIKRIRAASPNNNILVVANEESLKKATKHDPGVLHQCQCGVVTDSSLALLNAKAKILMLKDERVIAYDYLTIIEP